MAHQIVEKKFNDKYPTAVRHNTRIEQMVKNAITSCAGGRHNMPRPL